MLLEDIQRRLPLALPYPHFMALAPLDCWFRMLAGPNSRVPPRYWLRLASGLFTSAIGTALTLPERVVLAPIISRQRRETGAGRFVHPPGTVVILGFYRTGTTHLHYLLSCDPRFRTTRWFHALAPQGFLLSWAFLRLFLIPFMSERRPQDEVAFGPDLPAEDDFALHNWGLASSLTGRLVLPRAYETYRRFDSLAELSPREQERWRRYQWAFLWKLTRLAPRRSLLLKTPSHTGRVGALRDFFTPDGVKFIHLSRSPAAVVESNVKMFQTLGQRYSLQPVPDRDELERRVVSEYIEAERRYDRDRRDIPPDHIVEMRFEDLVADPVGQIRAAYDRLGLDWSDHFQRRLERYLETVRDYQPKTLPDGDLSAGVDPDGELARLSRRFGHDRPVREAIPPSSSLTLDGAAPGESEAARITRLRWVGSYLVPIVAALSCAALWLLIANMAGNRYDTFVWPVGIAVGYAAMRSSACRAGSSGRGACVRRGLWASALTLIVLLSVAWPNTRNVYYAHRTEVAAIDVWRTTRLELTTGPTVFWALMGMVTAYRFGSRRGGLDPTGGGLLG